MFVGIPRSGAMVANILALYLNLQFIDISNFANNGSLTTGTTRKCRNWIKTIEDAEHMLIVDDSISSGKAIKETKQLLTEKNVKIKCTYMTIYDHICAACQQRNGRHLSRAL